MKKLLSDSSYFGNIRIEERYEWDETLPDPQVKLVTYRDGVESKSEKTLWTPEAITAYIADKSKRDQVRDEYMMA